MRPEPGEPARGRVRPAPGEPEPASSRSARRCPRTPQAPGRRCPGWSCGASGPRPGSRSRSTAAARSGPTRSSRRPRTDDRARRGLDQPVDHLQQGRLARAAGAEDGQALARRDLQVHPAQRLVAVGIAPCAPHARRRPAGIFCGIGSVASRQPSRPGRRETVSRCAGLRYIPESGRRCRRHLFLRQARERDRHHARLSPRHVQGRRHAPRRPLALRRLDQAGRGRRRPALAPGGRPAGRRTGRSSWPRSTGRA